MNILTKLNKYKGILTIAFVAMMGLTFSPTLANAQEADTFGLDKIGGTLELGDKPLEETVAGLINVALGFLGIIAVVIILAGGFKWMTAGGNDDKVAEARKLIFSGIIGLAIILSAWAITRFVFESLVEATGSGELPF